MTIKKIDDMDIRGPINGMCEADLRGVYYRVAFTLEDDEIIQGRLTLAQLQELRDQCDHHLSKQAA